MTRDEVSLVRQLLYLHTRKVCGAPLASRQEIPVTPSVLRWAIRESGYEDVALADELGVALATLREWQAGDARPSKMQFDALASRLRRPTALFFLPRPPTSHTPSVKFRRPHGSSRTKPSAKELRYLREAARVQATIAWSIRELATETEPLPSISANSEVESAATRIRQHLLAKEPAKSPQATSDAQIQNQWRARIESIGTLVFFLPLGADSVRGFSLYDDVAPLIAINTKWDYRPRIFSMLHEFAHLVSRTSSACVESFTQKLPEEDDRIERWCEQVASAVLMPWDEVIVFIRTRLQVQRDRISKLEHLYAIAGHFKTSARATAIRLIGKGVADWYLYHQIPPASEQKRGGGGGKGRTRTEIREDEYGARALRLFARAVERGLITSTDASGFLKVSDLELEPWR